MIVKDLDECEYRCYLDANCVSLNIKNKDPNGTHECELNNSTHLEHDGVLTDDQLYNYRGAEVSNYEIFNFAPSITLLDCILPPKALTHKRFGLEQVMKASRPEARNKKRCLSREHKSSLPGEKGLGEGGGGEAKVCCLNKENGRENTFVG